MDSKIGFEMNLIVVEAIRGLCASFTVLTATVSEIFGGQTTPSILVVDPIDVSACLAGVMQCVYWLCVGLVMYVCWSS